MVALWIKARSLFLLWFNHKAVFPINYICLWSVNSCVSRKVMHAFRRCFYSNHCINIIKNKLFCFLRLEKTLHPWRKSFPLFLQGVQSLSSSYEEWRKKKRRIKEAGATWKKICTEGAVQVPSSKTETHTCLYREHTLIHACLVENVSNIPFRWLWSERLCSCSLSQKISDVLAVVLKLSPPGIVYGMVWHGTHLPL